MIRRPPRSPLFPYPPLFRSVLREVGRAPRRRALEPRPLAPRGLGPSRPHLHRRAERERERLRIAPRALGPRVDLLDLLRVLVWQQHRGRPEADRMPGVAESASALERGVGVTADPDRDPNPLRGLRQRVDVPDPVVLTLERDGIGGPGRAHEPEGLVGHRAALLKRGGRERLELLPEPPDARAEDEP